MNTLSIFVDESGDFGKVDNASPYYIVTLVMHNQSESILEEINHLENSISYLGTNFSYIHTGPIIRREQPYHNMTIDERRHLLYLIRSFTLHTPIKYTSLIINRKEATEKFTLTAVISRKLKEFITENLKYFSEFNKIIVYYDNGQQELNLVLNTVFNVFFSNIEFRKASPNEYRLLQISDFICSIELLSIKLSEKRLSKSESSFFYKPQELKKTFIKAVKSKHF